MKKPKVEVEQNGFSEPFIWVDDFRNDRCLKIDQVAEAYSDMIDALIEAYEMIDGIHGDPPKSIMQALLKAGCE